MTLTPTPPPIRRTVHRKSLLAPAVSAVVIAAVGVWGLGVPRVAPDTAYLARVASAIDAIPYSVGGMVGTDVTPTPAAVKLLKPNRILQRQYMDPSTGHASSLLVVHCADLRDMLGHYPPVCYPAHGWVIESAVDTELTWDGKAYPAKMYRFSRSGGDMSAQSMSVLSFFVLPGADPAIVADMDHLERAARKPEIAGRGAAQFQILSLRQVEQRDQQTMTSALLEAAAPAIRSVREESSTHE